MALSQRRREYMKGYLKRYGSLWKKRLKEEVLTHYGNGHCACIKCGFDDIEALTIDHIEPVIGRVRSRNGNSGSGTFLYRQLRRDGYPEGYQTLCMNCQFIKQSALQKRYKTATNRYKPLQSVT